MNETIWPSTSPVRTQPLRSATSLSQLQTTARKQQRRPTIAIRFISVVHYTKENGKCLYACRVIGEADNQAYTVSKTWDQFLDFSNQLCEAYPALGQKHLPRLNKKMTLFVTRSTLVNRREELDLWVKRLVNFPEVKKGRLFNDFFAPPSAQDDAFARLQDFNHTVRAPQHSTHSPRPSLTSTSVGAIQQDPFARSPVHHTFHQTQGLPVPSSSMRPYLNHKRSTPNLRLHEELEIDIPETPLPMSPSATAQIFNLGMQDSSSVAFGTWQVRSQSRPSSPTSNAKPSQTDAHGDHFIRSRPSLDSVARSVSTDHTITPSNFMTRSITSVVVTEGDTEGDADQMTELPAVTVIKQDDLPPRPKGLRHFMSLQDIRQHVLPHPTIPMANAKPPQQSPVTPTGGSQVTASPRPPMPRSRSSSGASEMSRPPFDFVSTMMMREHSDSAVLARPRRPSARSQHSVRSFRQHHQNYSGSSSRHSHSQSSSSLASTDTGRGDWSLHSASNRDSMSGSTSTESGPASPMSFMPATPPTPQWTSETSFLPNKPVLDHELVTAMFSGNLVPLPPTFARPSLGSRSRSGSLAQQIHSNRSNLDPILGSPTLASPEDQITVKVRHQAANVVLKVDRASSLTDVKAKIAEKLRGNGITVKPVFDVWLCPRREATTTDADCVPSSPATPLTPGSASPLNDLSWDHASGASAKIVLIC